MDERYTERLRENLRLTQLELVMAYETELAKWRAAAYYLAGYLAASGRRQYPPVEKDAHEWIEEAFGQGE